MTNDLFNDWDDFGRNCANDDELFQHGGTNRPGKLNDENLEENDDDDHAKLTGGKKRVQYFKIRRKVIRPGRSDIPVVKPGLSESHLNRKRRSFLRDI